MSFITAFNVLWYEVFHCFYFPFCISYSGVPRPHLPAAHCITNDSLAFPFFNFRICR